MQGNTHEDLSTYLNSGLVAYTHAELRGTATFKRWTASDFYNYGELNRIEDILNQAYVLARPFYAGVGIPNIRTDRTMSSFDMADSLNRLEHAIEHLGSVTRKPTGWITTKTDWKALDRFSYIDANRYEINVELLYRYIEGNTMNVPYCGQLYVGEEWI